MRPLDQWAGAFGDAYTERNRVDWQDRYAAWYAMVNGLPIHSALEVGPNRGHNLIALERVIAASTMHRRCECVGIEPNAQAVRERLHPGVRLGTLEDVDGLFDMVFTAGVLIHVPPEELEAFITQLGERTRRYLLVIEYDAPIETAVRYRGETGLLWKRPWQQEVESRLPELTVRRSGFWRKEDGFDRCHWWLWEKP